MQSFRLCVKGRETTEMAMMYVRDELTGHEIGVDVPAGKEGDKLLAAVTRAAKVGKTQHRWYARAIDDKTLRALYKSVGMTFHTT
jgi:hypothetical protein